MLNHATLKHTGNLNFEVNDVCPCFASLQVDLVKDAGHQYFVKFLDMYDSSVDLHSRAQAAFVLAAICDGHPKVGPASSTRPACTTPV